MANSKTTIELNGKLYDARTGKILGESTTKPKQSVPRNNGAVMDGFTRRPQIQTPVATQPAKKAKPTTARTAPAHAATKLQKSKTLMRPAVSKPKPVIKSDVSRVKHEIRSKQDPARTARAASVVKSSAINRYGAVATDHRIIKKVAHMPVASQPAHLTVTQKVAHLATSTEAHLKQSVDVIEESLRNASAHLERFDGDHIKRSFHERFGFRNKVANLSSFTFAVLLLVGFFAWQNAPNLEMRVAATRSGVAAHMPGYKPAGFGVSRNVKIDPGKVAVTFRSNTDDKKYTVTQQASTWSSDSLLSNHVLATRQPFQTYQDQGKTVYIYDNSNATWVSGGVWYRIDGNANLTSDQLLRIANSF